MSKVKYLSTVDIINGLSPGIRLGDREIEPIKEVIRQIAPQASLIFHEGPNRQKKKHEYPNTFSKYADYEIVGCEDGVLRRINTQINPVLESGRREEHKNQSCNRIIKVHKIDSKYIDKLIKEINPNIYLKSYYTRQAYNTHAESPFSYTVYNAKDKEEGDKVSLLIGKALRSRRTTRELQRRNKLLTC